MFRGAPWGLAMTPEEIARLLGHSPAGMMARYGERRGTDVVDRHVVATARRDLEGRMMALHDVVSAKRLEAFRAYSGMVVATVSPLLLRICALAGLCLDELAYDMRPDAAWQPWVCGRRPFDGRQRQKGGKVSLRKLAPDELARCDLDWFAHAGLVVVPPGDGPLPFGMRVLDRGLEVAAMLGDARLRTHGHTGSLTIVGELSATIAAALPGRRLGDVFANPALQGQPCLITQVDDPGLWGTPVTFAMEPSPWTMPWSRDGGAS